jgi:hypothetical protein
MFVLFQSPYANRLRVIIEWLLALLVTVTLAWFTFLMV